MRKAKCVVCGKEGEVPTTERGYFESEAAVRRAGFYWSNQESCFYCLPCSDAKTADLLRQIVDLCQQHGTEIRDFQGNVLLPGKKTP